MITRVGKEIKNVFFYEKLISFYRSTSQYNSLQPFQPVFYPSAIASIARSSSNPDLASDPIAVDARNLTEKMNRVRKFWEHGIHTATSSLVDVRSQSLAQPVITQPNDS